jgi:UDP-2,3-diacylglucosamine pyrophosphatase LpxH
MADNGTKITYIPGNHDAALQQLAGRDICGIDVELEASHRTAAGEHLLVTHGDCLERHTRRGTKLEVIGAAAYQWLIDTDATINRLRRRLSREFLSMSASVKLRLKSANEYIRRLWPHTMPSKPRSACSV